MLHSRRRDRIVSVGQYRDLRDPEQAALTTALTVLTLLAGCTVYVPLGRLVCTDYHPQSDHLHAGTLQLNG